MGEANSKPQVAKGNDFSAGSGGDGVFFLM